MLPDASCVPEEERASRRCVELPFPTGGRYPLSDVLGGSELLSPHLLRPYTAQQLNLTRRAEKVMVLAALGGRQLGPALQVHAPTLVSRIGSTLLRTDVVVFIDEPVPDAATVNVIESMLDDLGGECGLVRSVAATEAVKRLENGVVAEGIDRSSLFSPRPPEILRRECLTNAVISLTDEQWINPSALVLAQGGSIRTFDDTHMAHLR